MKTVLTIILSFATLTIFGNINYIQFEKIPESEKYNDKFDFIKDIEGYYNHWQPDWTYAISKKSLIKGLKLSFQNNFFELPDRINYMEQREFHKNFLSKKTLYI